MTDLNPDTAPDVTDPAPAAPAAAEKKDVKVAPAKGRPMLSWVGKRPLSSVAAYPAQLMERYDVCPAPPFTPFLDREGSALAPGLGSEGPGEAAPPAPSGSPIIGGGGGLSPFSDWPAAYPHGGLLFHGDNKEVLGHLLANGFRGKVNLVYIDPPFDSGADYVRKVSLRGVANTAKLAGEAYTLGEQTQYSDIWANDNYLQFLYERLLLLKELLAENGSIFLHCDNNKMHYIRCLLDEVFGQEQFVNEIVWQHQIMGGAINKLPKAHETIFWYVKGNNILRRDDPNIRVPFSKYVQDSMRQDKNGQWFYERRRMSRKATVAEAASKAHTRTYVPNPDAGTVVTDVWSDMLSYQETPDEREGVELYPTQKSTKLLTRVISAASDPGDLILDCFMGSGVVAKVAQKLGRRWIGCDINKGAIQTTAKRLHTIMEAQCKAQDAPAKAGRNGSRKGKADAAQQEMAEMEPVPAEGGEAEPTAEDVPATARPAQTSFSSWRVNDYDLQIQHNEAVELACELIGVERNRTDGFFDGKRGGSLTKIIPFNHALTPLDIEEVALELRARPNEMRPILLVCLGRELAAQARVEEWNRLLKKDSPNYLEVIELRSDPKYGGVFQHAPDEARVTSQAEGDKLIVEITDFVSPTIQERLNKTVGILQPVIDDWRAMVDCVLIDTDYHAPVFQVAHADIPEKKTDLVHGRYELPMPPPGATIAVKIIDMLGEEVLKTLHAPSRT